MKLEWIIVLLLLYIPVHVFNGAILEPLPKTVRRRLNKVELVLLLPLGMIYNFAVLSFLRMGFVWIDCKDGIAITTKFIAFLFQMVGFENDLFSESLASWALPEINSMKFYSTILQVIVAVAVIHVVMPFWMGNLLGKKRLHFSKNQFKNRWSKICAVSSLIRMGQKSHWEHIKTYLIFYAGAIIKEVVGFIPNW